MLTATQKMIIVAVIGFGLGFGGCFIWLSGKDARLAKSIKMDDEVSAIEEGTDTDAALKKAMREKVDSLAAEVKTKQIEVAAGTNGAAAVSLSQTPVATPAQPPVTATVPAVISGAATISVSNQKAGDKVVVDSVTFTNPGWAVVYEYTGGQLGHVLGAYYRNPGTYKGLVVELLRNTVAGSAYAVTVSNEDGDKNYDYRKDIPLVDSSGKTILSSFTAQ